MNSINVHEAGHAFFGDSLVVRVNMRFMRFDA
jgi:hypothetical protein